MTNMIKFNEWWNENNTLPFNADTYELCKKLFEEKEEFINEIGWENIELEVKCSRLSQKYYIRFGEIPLNERSKKGNGIIGDGYECVGYEEGVSVWNAVELEDGWHLVAPLNSNSCTHGDFSSMAFPDDCCGCDPNQKIYVVMGEEVGKGADNEPLIKNVMIIKELPFDYFKMNIKGNKATSTIEE